MSTLQIEPSDPPFGDYVLRQRIRQLSSSSESPNSLILPKEAGRQKSPWAQWGWLFIVLLICLPTFHLLLGEGLKAFRYRHYSQPADDEGINRMDFLTHVLPTKLLRISDIEPAITGNADAPLVAPFQAIDLENISYDNQLVHDTVSQLKRIEGKFRNCSEAISSLASVRKHTYVAKGALEKLHSSVSSTTEDKGTPANELAPKILQVSEALKVVEKFSEKYEMHRALIPPAIHKILVHGIKQQGKKVAKKRDPKFRVGCKAKAYKETVGKLEEQFGTLLNVTEEMNQAAHKLSKAALGVCQHAAEASKAAELFCTDALAILWKLFRPKESDALKEIAEVDFAKLKAGIKSDELVPQLREIRNDLKVQHNGAEVWIMFLETMPGSC